MSHNQQQPEDDEQNDGMDIFAHLETESRESIPLTEGSISSQTLQDQGIPEDMLPDLRNMRKAHLQTELGTSDANEIAHALEMALQKPVIYEDPITRQSSLPKGRGTRNVGGRPPAQESRVPDWYRVGWTSFSTNPNPGGKLPWMATYRKEPDTYNRLFQTLTYILGVQSWDDGLTILAVGISTWVLSRLGAGPVSFFVIILFLASYHHRSQLRFRRHARDDILRELTKIQLEAAPESVDWLNSILGAFWRMFEPVVSQHIVAISDSYLVDYIPSFLHSLRLTTFTLGNKPLTVDRITTHTDTDADTSWMEWVASFTPNDTTDMTRREIDNKVNPKIILNVRFGKGRVGTAIPILIEDINIEGNLRLRFKLTSRSPYVKCFEACFQSKPQISYVLKPIGGESFGFDINHIPGMESYFRDLVHNSLGPMMYYPNVYSLDLEKFFSGELDINQANGVLAVTVYSCTPLANTSSQLPNPYVRFFLDKAQELGRTSVRYNTREPNWNETKFLLLNNLDSILTLELRNNHSSAKDQRLARAHFDLRELEDDEDLELLDRELLLMRKNKQVTTLKADMRFLPVSRTKVRRDGTVEPAVDSNSGILRFTVHECLQLGSASRNPYAIVYINGTENIRTRVLKRNPNPKFEQSGEVVVLDRTNVQLRVEVKDRTTFAEDSTLGEWSLPLVDMMRQQERFDFWWPLAPVTKGPSGRIRLSVQWKPVVMTGLIKRLNAAHFFQPAIGVIRFSLWFARQLRNVEAVTGGKSDPYVRILSGSQVRARTEVIDNNLNPEWAEIHYVPVHSLKDDLQLEVMDWNSRTKDKSLGYAVLRVKELFRCVENVDGTSSYYEQIEPIARRNAQLTSRDHKADKGYLNYSAEFYPMLSIPNIPDDKGLHAKENEKMDEQSTLPSDVPALSDLHGVPIRYTPDDLIDLSAYNSGILTIRVEEVRLHHYTEAYCQILVDTVLPLHKTAALKGHNLYFNETTDAFVKELDFSRIAIEIKELGTDEADDDKLGYWIDTASNIVRHIQRSKRLDPEGGMRSEEYNLLSTEGHCGTVRLAFAYTPMADFTLPFDEGMENQGNLTVALLRAEKLRAADRSGTSDPFVIFSINGQAIHQSKVIKKTLNPFWQSEEFSVPITSRSTTSFRIEVFDWNQVQAREPLGSGGVSIQANMLESFVARVYHIPLEDDHGPCGSVYIRMLWQPQLLLRKKTHTISVLSATTRALTSVATTGTNLIGTALDVGSLRSKHSGSSLNSRSSHGSATFLTRIQSWRSSSFQSLQSISHIENEVQPRIESSGDNMTTVTVIIVEARHVRGVDRGGTSNPYVKVYRGKERIYKTKTKTKTLTPQWDEQFTISTDTVSTWLLFKLKDYNMFSSSRDLGEFVLEIRRDLGNVDDWFPLVPHGSGEIHLRITMSE